MFQLFLSFLKIETFSIIYLDKELSNWIRTQCGADCMNTAIVSVRIVKANEATANVCLVESTIDSQGKR